MPKNTAYALTFVLCLLLQFAVAPAICIGGIEPNFLLIPVVLVGLRSGYASGSAMGFICGLLEDFAGSEIIGCMALSMLIVGLLAGIASSVMEIRTAPLLAITAFVAAVLNELAYGLIVVLSSADSAGVLSTVVSYSAFTALYTAVMLFIALVTINLVMHDDPAPSTRLSGGTSYGRPLKLKSRRLR